MLGGLRAENTGYFIGTRSRNERCTDQSARDRVEDVEDLAKQFPCEQGEILLKELLEAESAYIYHFDTIQSD